MSLLKVLSIPEIRAQLDYAGRVEGLHPRSTWRNRATQDVVTVVGISFDGDLEEVVVQFKHEASNHYTIHLSQRMSSFLKTYEQVESVQRWEPVRDRPDR